MIVEFQLVIFCESVKRDQTAAGDARIETLTVVLRLKNAFVVRARMSLFLLFLLSIVLLPRPLSGVALANDTLMVANSFGFLEPLSSSNRPAWFVAIFFTGCANCARSLKHVKEKWFTSFTFSGVPFNSAQRKRNDRQK